MSSKEDLAACLGRAPRAHFSREAAPFGRPELAEQVARIWFALLEHLSHGPEGLRDARLILKRALRFTYPFTASCRLAYRHYKLSLSGLVDPEDEPSELLSASVKRARESIADSKAAEK